MPTISSRLREQREALDLSQQALADRCGISARSQRNYESGERLPDAAYLAAIDMAGADMLYVVTGKRSNQTIPPLPADEQMWLDCYREWDAPTKKQELRRAMGVLPDGAAPSTPAAAPIGKVGGAYSQHNSGANSVQIGGYGGKVTIKKGR